MVLTLSHHKLSNRYPLTLTNSVWEFNPIMVSGSGHPSNPRPSSSRGLRVPGITAIRGNPSDSYDENEIFKDWISKTFRQVTSFAFQIDHERSWWHARIQVNGQFTLWSKNTVSKVFFQPQVIFTHHSGGPRFFLVQTRYLSLDWISPYPWIYGP